ncbi:MAG TPA: hypothetical protein VK717_04345 [Opitutaceae bacterium]|nr:hypothetical protein [Opitutaceae bacterium]
MAVCARKSRGIPCFSMGMIFPSRRHADDPDVLPDDLQVDVINEDIYVKTAGGLDGKCNRTYSNRRLFGDFA